jgi:hypothetical protein
MPVLPLTAKGPTTTVDVGRAPEPASVIPPNINLSLCWSILSILMWAILLMIWF